MSDTRERLALSLRCKEFSLAVADAVKLKDVHALTEISQTCEDELIKETAEKALASFNK